MHECRVRKRHGTRCSWQLGKRKCPASKTILFVGTRSAVIVAASLRFGAMVWSCVSIHLYIKKTHSLKLKISNKNLHDPPASRSFAILYTALDLVAPYFVIIRIIKYTENLGAIHTTSLAPCS